MFKVHQAYGHEPSFTKERKDVDFRDSATSATSVDTLESLEDEFGCMDLSEILANEELQKSTPATSRRACRGKTPKRSVSFDKVEIRAYEQILGDNPPSCAPGGPSLTLGWNYVEKKPISLDKHTSKSIFQFTKIRKQKKDFLLQPEKREKIAKKLGFTNQEIHANVKQVDRISRQRKRTVDSYMEEQFDAVYFMHMARQAHGLVGGQ